MNQDSQFSIFGTHPHALTHAHARARARVFHYYEDDYTAKTHGTTGSWQVASGPAERERRLHFILWGAPDTDAYRCDCCTPKRTYIHRNNINRLVKIIVIDIVSLRLVLVFYSFSSIPGGQFTKFVIAETFQDLLFLTWVFSTILRKLATDCGVW